MGVHDLIIMIIIGGIFVVLGIIGFIFGKKEEGTYYGTISERIDVREFMDHLPWRPEPDSLRIGGKIAMAVGVVLLLICLGVFLWGLTPGA
jgi:hypothetical protein